MQFIIVTIRRGVNPGDEAMLYPTEYNSREIHLNSVDPLLRDEGIALGNATEEMLVYITDNALAARLALSSDIRKVNRAQADTWMTSNPKVIRSPEERVTDADRLNAIDLKQRLGQTITPEDLQALDPDNPTLGINRVRKNTEGYYKLPPR